MKKPVQSVKDAGDVCMFTHPHQDPDSAVLSVLELWKALARVSDEECVTVVKPGGDKGMDELLRKGKRWPELGNITKVKEGNFANVGDMIFKAKMGVKNLTPKICDGGRQEKVVAKKANLGQRE